MLPATGDELRPGDLVVHAEHGIGRLRGLELHQADPEVPADEYLSVEFASERKLLVPVLEADQIWRYGSEAAEVPLDRLGGDDWRARRAEIETQLEATAGELLVLARQRRTARGPELRPPAAVYRRFATRCPFGATADQT